MRLKETPFWWEGLAAAVDANPTALPARADVAVVGGGYTGLSAARSLALAGASVVLLEKETLGWGASSRNGGQVLTGMKVGADALIARFGREHARAFHRASLDAIAFVERLVREEAIECGFRRAGHLDAAAKPAHFERFKREQETLEREFGHRVLLVPKSEQSAELGSDYYHGVMLDELSGALDPARYVRGLAAAAARRGVALFAGTAVRAIERVTGGGFRVSSDRGAVSVRDVLIATNGYSDAAVPALRRRVVPIGSYMIASEPLAPKLAAALLPQRRMVFDSKNFLFYFRLSDDGRLLFGGRAQFTPSTASSTRSSAEILRRGMVEVFPELAGAAIEYAWSGNVAFTMDLMPHAGRLGGLHYAMGYCGHGVGMASHLGDVMADVLLGRPDRNPFGALAFRAIPLYRGRPWFLPLAGLWYKLRDWIQ
jgi:glycine/D-amino acid oxidase-like deaminating enzyme